ncbi:hypothetical protein [Plantactinospora veratri]
MEHGRQVEQFPVRFHTELLGVDEAEEEDPPGVVVEERVGRLLEDSGRVGDRRRLGNLQSRDNLWHDL